MDTVVYFVRDGDLVKIGFTRDIHKRMKAIYGVLIGCIPGGYAEEQTLHRQFDALREWGEWFRCEPALMSFIEALPPCALIAHPRSARPRQRRVHPYRAEMDALLANGWSVDDLCLLVESEARAYDSNPIKDGLSTVDRARLVGRLCSRWDWVIEQLTMELHGLMCVARRDGESLRAIAGWSGLTPEGVRHITDPDKYQHR